MRTAASISTSLNETVNASRSRPTTIPVVNAAIHNRINYLNTKADSLYSIEICFVILYEGFRHKASILNCLAALPSNPAKAIRELLAMLSTRKQLLLIESELDRSRTALRAKARNFCAQVLDFVGIRTLPKTQAFRVLKQILNFSPLKIENARLKHDTFLDYYLCESHLECHRGFLRVDDFYVKVLTLKEPSAHSFPLIFKAALGSRSQLLHLHRVEEAGTAQEPLLHSLQATALSQYQALRHELRNHIRPTPAE